MKISGKIAVVTGGGGGIGEAMCRRFRAEGAELVVADVDAAAAARVAEALQATAVAADSANEAEIRRIVSTAEQRFGRIDLFCSNAGIAVDGGVEVEDSDWQRIWQTNVMSHVYAARAVLPGMLRRREGYLLQTASAAGLLTQIGSAPYSVTKHAAVGFAEWLAIRYRSMGIRVSCLCPQGVRTAMLDSAAGGIGEYLRATAIDADAVAAAVVDGIEAERFLILPHPEVAEFFRNKATDYERWIRGMHKLQEKLGGLP